MADQAWLEAFKAAHGWYPWEDPNLAAKGFSPEDAYAEHLVAKAISEQPKAPTFVKSWQNRYGMTDKEKPYLKPAAIPDLPARPGSAQVAQQATAGDMYAMTNDTGPGYVPGMQRSTATPYVPTSPYSPAAPYSPGADQFSPEDPYSTLPPEAQAFLNRHPYEQDLGGTGTTTPMFEETPYATPSNTPVWAGASASPTPISRATMTPTVANTPVWAQGPTRENAVMQSIITAPSEIQSEVYGAIQNRQPLSEVARDAVTLLAERAGMSPDNYIRTLAGAMGVK
jgi:hypothetical protein